jgi:hypothetical protein
MSLCVLRNIIHQLAIISLIHLHNYRIGITNINLLIKVLYYRGLLKIHCNKYLKDQIVQCRIISGIKNLYLRELNLWI